MRSRSRITTWPSLRPTARMPRDRRSNSQSKYLGKRRMARAREETGTTRRPMRLSKSGSRTTARRISYRRGTRREDPGPRSARMTPRTRMTDQQPQKWLIKRGRSQFTFRTIRSCQLMIALTAATVVMISSAWLLTEKWRRNCKVKNQRNQRRKVKK